MHTKLALGQKQKSGLKTGGDNMKLSKILLTGAVLAAAMTAFVACVQEDDPNDMIDGSGNNYTLEYTNDSTEISRGYVSTRLQHAGCLAKVTFDKSSDVGGGVMGIVFDLQDNATNPDAVDFNVVAFRTTSDGAEYYISKFANVTDTQANNFGAPAKDYAGNGATETEVVKAFKAVPSNAVTTSAEGKSVYIWFVQKPTTGENPTMQYEVYFLPESIASKAETKDLNNDNGDLFDKETGVALDVSSYKAGTIATAYTEQTQKKFAVYANVYANKTVSGTWEFLGTYKEANVVEE